MRHLRNPYVQVGLWTFAITLVVAVAVWTVPWEPEQASTQAGPIDTLYDVLALISAFVFAAVVSILIVSVVHFRKRSPDDLRDGAPLHGNTRLEVIWTTIPAILMVGTAVYSGLVLADIEDSKANEHTIEVTAEQFAWTFEYPEGRQFRSGELHLVKDTPYHFKLNAKDVLHSFWVPAVPHEEGRGPRHRDGRARHPHAPGSIHTHVCRVVRARARHDACDRGGRGAGRVRPLGRTPAQR